MNKRHFIGLVTAGAGSFALGAFINYRNFNDGLLQNNEKFILVASEKSTLELIEGLTNTYNDKNKATKFMVKKASSLEAIIAAKLGSIDLAVITRDLSDDEDNIDIFNYLIARSSISIIVNPLNPITDLTREQVRDLFIGNIKSWKLVGGTDSPVNVISRSRDSSTRQYFEDNVLEGADYANTARELKDANSLSEAVASDIYSIGFIAAKDARTQVNVKRVDIDGVSATKATVLSGRYPFTSSIYLLLAGKDDGDVKNKFVGFIRSSAGQDVIEKLMPVC